MISAIAPFVLGLVLLAAGPPPAIAPVTARAGDWAPASGVRAITLASGLEQPVHAIAPAGDVRLFIVEQNYTDGRGDTRVARFRVSGDPDVADASSERLVLRVEQPYSNHNGGHIVFAPDGKLWIGMGDGGAGGDPHGHGQNRGSLLGKMLRVDVDRGEPYAVPSDNPFLGRLGARNEIWAIGLRTPWRFAFDRVTGLLYIADVGQNRLEEVHVASASAAGLNYGWNVLEGTASYRHAPVQASEMTPPALEYDHAQGCSVTGGVVYRGRALPALAGTYLFSDYCRGWLRGFRFENGRARDLREWDVGDLGSVTSFGEDAQGEVIVLNHEGRVMKLVPAR
jgi:glucose/arabinose dehydrogenase